MSCQTNLLKSIQYLHCALLCHANSFDQEKQTTEQELFYQFGFELSSQLKELKALYSKTYNVDSTTLCCGKKRN